MLLYVSVLGVAAITTVSKNVTDDTWQTVELKPLYVQSGGDIFSDQNEDYYEFWWEGEIPELGDGIYQACTVNMRGFAMSTDGRYLYMGTLNGGTGVRGVTVFDTKQAKITDLYYKYDGEAGHTDNPFSYAKGIATDDRGYVYAGFAFSKNYNIVNLGIARQQEDGTLEEVYYDAVYAFGNPGDEGGIKVGVNGVDVAKVGDKYYCYFMTNYTYDALYCYDVTDPANPKLNKDFGKNGCIIFSDPSNTVVQGFKPGDGYYMDVDEDGTIWLIADSETDAMILKIAPDGSACVELIPANDFYCVEHVNGYLLMGDYRGECIEVRDDASYEVVARIDIQPEFGDRVTRIQIANDVLFVCEAGNDTVNINTIHAAPLSPAGQEFFNKLVANLAGESDETPTEAPDTEEEPETPPDTEPPVVTEPPATDASEETEAPDNAPATDAPATEAPKEGCGSTVAFAAVALLTAAAAFVARKKD
jgi:hypothetical protein